MAESPISELEKLQIKLKQTESLAKLGTWEFDLVSDKISWSDGVFHILGYVPQSFEVSFERAIEITHPEDREKSILLLQACVQAGEEYNIEKRFISRTGETKYILSRAETVRDASGKVVKLIGVYQDITEQKKLEYLLEETVNMARIGSWELNLEQEEHQNMYWSPMTKKLLEVEDSYIPILTEGFEFYDSEFKEKIKNCVENLIEYGEQFDLELLLTTAKGNQQWVRCIGKSERRDGKCLKIFGSFQDIHERKVAELELKSSLKSLEDYKFALDQSAIIAITDQKGVILSINDNFCKISKYAREELLGQTHRIINSGHHSREFFRDLWKTISAGKVWRGEVKNKAKDGSYYWVDTTIVPFLDNNEKPFQYLAIRFDITSRKEADQRFISSLQERNTILESIGDGLINLDKNWIVTYWNRQAENILGMKRSEVLGKNIWDVYSDAVGLDFYRHYHQAMESGQSVVFEEYYPTLNIWVEVSAFPSIEGLSIYFKDVTERKKTEEELKIRSNELERSNKELEQFAFVTSHDLQEPLRMITSFLNLLEKKYGAILDQNAIKYIGFASDGAKRMKQIIIDLLEFSRMGIHDGQKELVDTGFLLDEYVLLRKRLISSKKAKLIYKGMPKLHTFKSPLIQVFHNILDNALKYSKKNEPPVILVSFQENSDHYEFSISDNGIGIPKEFHEKVFVIFQRLHNRDEFSGSGMGLAIVKKNMENLGGKIWIESEPENGSTFCFTVPK